MHCSVVCVPISVEVERVVVDDHALHLKPVLDQYAMAFVQRGWNRLRARARQAAQRDREKADVLHRVVPADCKRRLRSRVIAGKMSSAAVGSGTTNGAPVLNLNNSLVPPSSSRTS